MDNDLTSIYENNYLRGEVVEESSVADKQILSESFENNESSVFEEARRKKKKKKSMSKKHNVTPEEAGAWYLGDSFNRPENIFDQILREMDEMGAGVDSGVGQSDNTYEAPAGAYEGEDEETFTLSELKSMSLAELADLIHGSGEDEYEEGEDEYGLEEGDTVPGESYGFTGGEGNHTGGKGHNGQASKQPATTHVDKNGDAKFGEADTGYDPEDTEGSEGSHHAGEGQDGQASKQPASNHVKSNGDADFSKAKTGYPTKSGKKDKNYF